MNHYIRKHPLHFVNWNIVQIEKEMNTLGLNANPKVVLRLRFSLMLTKRKKKVGGISMYDNLGRFDDKHKNVV